MTSEPTEHREPSSEPRRRTVSRRARRWLIATLTAAGGLALVVAVAIVLTAPPEREPAGGWSESDPMPVARGEGSAALGEVEAGCDVPPCPAIVVAGGFSFPFRTEARVDAYLLDEARWIRLPDLPSARHHPAAAALPDGTVVVSGGVASTTNWTPTDEVWALAPGAGSWAALDPLPEPRWGHRLVAVDDRLIAVGGQGGDATLIWSRDDGWIAGAPILEVRDHLGAVVVDGEVWVIGGRDADLSARVDIYDPERDEWRAGPPLPSSTSAAAVGALGRTIVVVSGEDDAMFGGGIVRDSWLIDLNAIDEGWTPLAPPPLDLHGAGDVVVEDEAGEKLYLLGGSSRHGAFSALAWNDRVFVFQHP